MIGLYIDNVFVEQFDDENITLTRQVKSLQTLGAVSDFTQTFNVPATPSNNKIFSHYYDISIVNGFSPHVKVAAKIEVDSVPVFNGVIELLGVTFDQGQPKQYQIVFYGDVKNLASIYGEETLRDVNWDTYEHTLTQPNVVNSWSDNLLGGAVKYPLWDYYEGVTYSNNSVDIPHNINKFGRGFSIDDVRPAIRFRDAVAKVIEHAGYNFDANGMLADRYFDAMYMLPVNQAGYMHDPEIKDTNKFVSSTAVSTRLDSLSFETLDYDTTTGNAGGAMNGTTGQYTAPISDLYKFSFTINTIAEPSSSYTLALTIAVYKNGTYHNTLMSITTLSSFTENFYMNLAKGDVIEIKTMGATGWEADSYSFSCTEAPYSKGGVQIKLEEVMPNMKLTDFIQGVLSTFNAILYLDGNTYHIKNTNDWYNAGNIVDWSNYIDLTSATHKKLKIPKRISFQHKAMKDMASIDFATKYQREFGSMSYAPDVDFTDGELKVSSPFSIVMPSVLNKVNSQYETIGTTNLSIPVLLNNDMKPACNELVLFYMSIDSYISSDSYYALGSVRNTYPHAGTFQEYNTSAGNSLAFSLEQNLAGLVPTDTLYSKWWQTYIARIFASSSRRVTMSAYLPVGEWLNLDMSNTIRVHDYYYKIEDISYNITTGQATLNMFTYTPVSVISPSTTGSGSVNFPANYVQPASQNLIFGGNAVLDNLFNTTETNGSRYVSTGVIAQSVTNMQYVMNAMTNVIANQYPKHLHMKKSTTSITVSSSTYTIVQNYDSLEDFNNGNISGNTTTGQWTTSIGGWVEVRCSVAWQGHDKLKVALLRDGIALKEQEVFSSSGSITLIDTTYLSDVGILEVGLIYTGGGEDKTYNISVDFEIDQTP